MDIIKKWNKFVRLMIATKDAWESLMQNASHSVIEVEKLSAKAQKILSIANRRANFEVAIPRLMAYWRGYGGLENLLIPVERKKPIEKEKEDEKQAA